MDRRQAMAVVAAFPLIASGDIPAGFEAITITHSVIPHRDGSGQYYVTNQGSFTLKELVEFSEGGVDIRFSEGCHVVYQDPVPS